jgi:thiamine-monophosphate kinase
MKLWKVGEKSLVELAKRVFKKGPPVKVGIGDDAAVIDFEDGRSVVATTDMLAAKTHFPLDFTPEEMARKAVVSNLSDLAAMGARPICLLFSVGLPRDLEFKFVEQLVAEMNKAALEYNTYVVGGDLNESDDIIIAGTAFGLVKNKEILLRSGARPGNLIGVTGTLGAAAAGFKLPSKVKGLKIPEPVARVREGRLLAKSKYARGAIDITDGLAANLWQLSTSSKVKLTIERDKLPVSPIAEKFSKLTKIKIDELLLFGGEDFELLFTFKPEGLSELRDGFKRLGTKLTIIGKVEKGNGVFISKDGKIEELPDRGYEHFRGSPKTTNVRSQH